MNTVNCQQIVAYLHSIDDLNENFAMQLEIGLVEGVGQNVENFVQNWK